MGSLSEVILCSLCINQPGGKQYSLEKGKETRIYVVSPDQLWDNEKDCEIDFGDVNDEEFMNMAEATGMVYSLNEFAEEYNQEDASQYFIRFITLPSIEIENSDQSRMIIL